MKKGSFSVLVIGSLFVVLLASLCGCGGDETSKASTEDNPSSTTQDGEYAYLPATPVKFGIGHKDQADLEANSNCQMCHGKGSGQDYPTPDKNGLWDGGKKGGNSTHHPGTYKVESGSLQDHTGRESQTLADCTKSGCHSF
ncbi:MAG: hypothetical protein FWH42_04705 [Dehalococcoidia bacterium]|nr:hypothetical protein [Dehalococcoidia bacterium]